MTNVEPLSLPMRMRLAAAISEEASKRMGLPASWAWRPDDLRHEADVIEQEESENE